MTILAITPYAGSKKLVRMTEEMLRSFRECVQVAGAEVTIVAMNNAAEDTIDRSLVDWHGWLPTNEGFGVAVNRGIQAEVFDMPKAGFPDSYTHVLVLNNDLEFPDKVWLRELLDEREGGLVLSPCTDVTATKCAVNDKAYDQSSRTATQVSAFCWLVPVATIKAIRKRFGFNLFSPEFSNYGSDDVSGAILRRLVGPRPFKVVPRSWVRHRKAQTANELGIKAGDPAVLRAISNFKRKWKLA